MGCPGGCINGGGQPPLVRGNVDLSWAVAGMYDTPDGTFRTMAGRADAGAAAATTTLADVMANVKFDGAAWGPCA